VRVQLDCPLGNGEVVTECDAESGTPRWVMADQLCLVSCRGRLLGLAPVDGTRSARFPLSSPFAEACFERFEGGTVGEMSHASVPRRPPWMPGVSPHPLWTVSCDSGNQLGIAD